MEWQTAYLPCRGTRRTKGPRKRCGLTPGRSSNARSFRGLLFESSRLYRRLEWLRTVLSVFFPLLLSWCLLYFCVFSVVKSFFFLTRRRPPRIPSPVKIEQVAGP